MRFFGRSGRRLSVSVRRARRGRAWSARAARSAAPYSIARLGAGAFLNVPYDDEYEHLYVALVAGLVAFGLNPRATLELPRPERRLSRILRLLKSCRYSFHDLSRVQLSHGAPRFNMPLELGLAVALSAHGSAKHRWIILEARPHRAQRTISDLSGTDPYCHHGRVNRLLSELSNALLGIAVQPNMKELRAVHRTVRRAARRIRADHGTVYGARAFKDLVFAATDAARSVVRTGAHR